MRRFILGAADDRCSFLRHCTILICTLSNIRDDKPHKTTHNAETKTSTVKKNSYLPPATSSFPYTALREYAMQLTPVVGPAI